MECYIVRIYQRETGEPDKIAGTVEEPERLEKSHLAISVS